MKKTLLAIYLFVSSGFFVYAQFGQTGATTFRPFTRLIASAQSILNSLVPFTIGLAVLGFFWFLVLFIWKGAENPAELKKAKEGIMWSLIALFAMMAVWGIIAFIANLLGIGLSGSLPPFKLPGEF